MERRPVRIITTPPIVAIIGETALNPHGIVEMAKWVGANRPECLPDIQPGTDEENIVGALFPHDLVDTDPFERWRDKDAEYGGVKFLDGKGRPLKGAELLPELAGRKCYDSFGLKAGRKSNADYLKHVLSSSPPHASIFYHTHITFFIGDTSRRLSQEMMRNYVGHGADHEGSPSQESTRYTVHHGAYVAHPWDIEADANGRPEPLITFRRDCETQYNIFMDYVESEMAAWHAKHDTAYLPRAERDSPDAPPFKGVAKMPTDIKKAILGSAAQRHGWGFATSYIWTSNPIALIKLFKERDHAAADPEFRRLARTWKRVCVMAYPNLFPMFIEEILMDLEMGEGAGEDISGHEMVAGS